MSYCTNCGKRFEGSDKLCDSCQSKTNSKQQTTNSTSAQSQKPQKKAETKKSFLGYFGVAAVILVIIVGFVFSQSNDDSSNYTSTSTSTLIPTPTPTLTPTSVSEPTNSMQQEDCSVERWTQELQDLPSGMFINGEPVEHLTVREAFLGDYLGDTCYVSFIYKSPNSNDERYQLVDTVTGSQVCFGSEGITSDGLPYNTRTKFNECVRLYKFINRNK